MTKEKTVAVLVDHGFEDSELARPVAKLRDAGYQIRFVGTAPGVSVIGKRNEEKADIDLAASDAVPEDYAGLLIPGGKSPESLRAHAPAVDFARAFFALGRPVAAVCHGPELLAEAGVLQGKKLTSYPEIRRRLEQAGATWIDDEVVVDGELITSRVPNDLDAFGDAFIAHLRHSPRRSAARET